MSFTDFWFYPKTAVLLVILLIVQALFRRRATVANTLSKLLLLAYSFYTLIFYNWQFAVYLGGVVLITYVAAILVDHFEKNVKKRTMVLSIVLLLLILGIFKYLNFFAGSFARVAGLAWTDLNIVLPLGISFYIFSAISYIVDVYWGLLPADRNLLNVALFLAFFPKLTCGPIVKGRDFLPQLQQYRHITRAGFEQGIQIFAFGLFKKMVLADHLGVFVDDVFRVPVAYNTGSIIWSALSYSLQIYFDFSGYSDMAVGLSKILGYELPRNFNLPYIAHDVSDFWGRWHISLSDWFKTYVYIPLGGSRKGKGRTYFNLFIVMLLSGLWHGAGWTFIAWGGFYGAWNCIHRLLNTPCESDWDSGCTRNIRTCFPVVGGFPGVILPQRCTDVCRDVYGTYRSQPALLLDFLCNRDTDICRAYCRAQGRTNGEFFRQYRWILSDSGSALGQGPDVVLYLVRVDYYSWLFWEDIFHLRPILKS